ncbi:MAG: PAS domain-containing protein, partial [Mailhella sp.]|nr:PAS domain-containing protein [Mailhella sp.]
MSQGLFQEDPMLSIREAFRRGDPIDESKVRPFILESWKRCRTLNVDGPSASRHVAPEVLKEALIKNSELLASSVPIMENLLSSVSAVHSVIGLADSEGLILHIAGAKEDISALEVFQTGWYATEDTSGTNGIGTGLIERRPLAILGAEHFYGDALGWCCTSAPIMNEGNFAGVLNITIKTDSYHQHTLSLVQAAAYAISEQLKLRLLFKEQTAMLESMTEGIIILDASLRIRTANKRARTMLGIDGDFAGRMLSDFVSNL